MRPHELDVRRRPVGSADGALSAGGIAAQLTRAIVVGPIARLELIPEGSTPSADNTREGRQEGTLIEAQIPAQQFHDMGLREGETLVLTPRRAQVFFDQGAGI